MVLSACSDGGETRLVLPLHKPQHGEDYLLGMFLGGVYQEVMGSNHNMLGLTHAVHVRTAAPSGRRKGDEKFSSWAATCLDARQNVVSLIQLP